MKGRRLQIVTSMGLLLFLGVGFAAPSSSQQGNLHLTFNGILAHHLNGNVYPERDADCLNEYQAQLETPIDVHYSIDPVTLRESARAILAGQTVRLYPLGIYPDYFFLSDGIPPRLMNVLRIGFNIKNTFLPESANAFVMYASHTSEDVLCVINAS